MLTRWSRWDPFEEIRAIQREISNLFDRFFGSAQLAPATRAASWVPPLEAFYHKDHLILRFFLPGVDPKTVDVSVTGNVLTVRGERKLEMDIPQEDYLFCEVNYGPFERTVNLPAEVKTDQVNARYQHGVLEISLPVAEAARPRKVPVEVK
ncbi:MAG: Hsp20/alpha crystallin family protein [Armatimonadetes bacterium]|nr:Hsp20/alpha crystallin family protein [Armatimonadota bacterium]MDW8154065.1 Hsp20/alpha crystallin family protein [Armatimonadota bacterium]